MNPSFARSLRSPFILQSTRWLRASLALAVALAVALSTCLAAYAATATYYRACCTDEPERHGCGISSWYSTAQDADDAGARHEQSTSGHEWTIETITRP